MYQFSPKVLSHHMSRKRSHRKKFVVNQLFIIDNLWVDNTLYTSNCYWKPNTDDMPVLAHCVLILPLRRLKATQGDQKWNFPSSLVPWKCLSATILPLNNLKISWISLPYLVFWKALIPNFSSYQSLIQRFVRGNSPFLDTIIIFFQDSWEFNTGLWES